MVELQVQNAGFRKRLERLEIEQEVAEKRTREKGEVRVAKNVRNVLPTSETCMLSVVYMRCAGNFGAAAPTRKPRNSTENEAARNRRPQVRPDKTR